MKLLLLLLSLSCVLVVGNLHANGGGYSKGTVSTSAFRPIGVDQVEMISERLEIDLHMEYADIRVEYVLHNPGRKVTVECGFPAVRSTDRHFMLPPGLKEENAAKPEMLEDFSISADGKGLKASILADNARLRGSDDSKTGVSELTSWHVVKIPFAEGQTRIIKAGYRNPYYNSTHHVSDDSMQSAPTLTYAFSAAALWAGPIKQGTVIINATAVDPAGVRMNHPKRYVLEKGRWTWSFTDFEPTLEDDLVVETRPGRHSFGRESGHYVAEGGEWKDDGLKGAQWMAYQNFTATASSTLKEPDGTEHVAENVADWNRGNAWVEGRQDHGVGESLTLTLTKPVKVSRVGIVNGYAKSRDLYHANNRVKRFLVSVNGGKTSPVDLPDEFLQQEHFWFDLPKTTEPVKTIRLEIASIFPGTRYSDTAISHIVLMQLLSKGPKIQPAR